MMMTIDQALDLLAAVERLAAAHGMRVDASVTTLRTHRVLLLEFRRGATCELHVSISEQAINACDTAAALTELVEREASAAISARRGGLAS